MENELEHRRNTKSDSKDGESDQVKSDQRILIFVLAVWVLIVWFSDFRFRPPQPRPASAPPELFSAERAEPILDLLVGDSIPHPAGSAQNVIVRERVVGLLEDYGYQVQLQSGVEQIESYSEDRGNHEIAFPITNVLARLQGTDSSSAILLFAHFDSHYAGPGACDDGVGVTAVLEIARMLASEPKPRRDVIFVLADGEEIGLFGAKMFVEEHAWKDDVAVAINLEARGTTGPSGMFQTTENSCWLVPLFARSSRRPYASSLFYEIYKRMPNDTDFTELKKGGLQGYDFAFIGDVKNYHTEDDNLANADRGSLQHHGDNALGLVRELLPLDIVNQQSGRVVYFDLFGWKVIWWPESWSLALACMAFVLFGLYSEMDARIERANRSLESPSNEPQVSGRKFLSLAQSMFGFFSIALVIAIFFAVGWCLVWLAEFEPRLQNLWPQHPIPYLVAHWLLPLPVACLLNMLAFRKLSLQTVVGAVGLLWIVLAAATAVLIPGASHLFIVPALLTGMTGACLVLAARKTTMSKWMAIAIPIFVGVMWLPLERLFYDAVGFRLPMVMLVRITIVSTALLPAIKCLNSGNSFRWALFSSILVAVSFMLAIFLN